MMTENRPWGSFTILKEGLDYKVKLLYVLPGRRLSLQRHRYRDENWTIVSGRAAVTVDGQRTLLNPGETIRIGRGQWHRVRCHGENPLEIIEVQIGECIEADIERKADDYGRADISEESLVQ